MRNASKLVATILIVALAAVYIPAPALAEATGVGDRVYVLGAVKNPGDFEYKEGMTARDALDLAGWLAPNADPAGVILVRSSGDKLPLNVEAIRQGKDKVALLPGDTIVVKPAIADGTPPKVDTGPAQPSSGNIEVQGGVRNPGRYEFKPGMTAADALALAGGPTESAAVAAAYISRDGGKIPTDLTSAGAKSALEAGDVLAIPQMTASITGEVAQPGSYPIVPGKTDNLEALFGQAGGATPKSDLKRIRISSVQGIERPTRTVNGASRDARVSVRVQNGDSVFVPERKEESHRRTTLNDVYQITIILATLISIFRH